MGEKMKSKISMIILLVVLIGLVIFANQVLEQYDIMENKIGQEEEKIKLNEEQEFGNISGNEKENEEKKLEENQEEEKMNILKLGKENFEAEVLNSKQTVLVDFYADWCGPCKMMSPVVEAIAKENPEIKVGKINIDEEEELAIQYQVMSIPTFMIVKNGEVVEKIVGAVDKSVLEEAIGE